MTAFPPHRCLLPILAGLLPLFLASCGSTQPKSGYSDVVDYTSPQTGLSQEEYPFDKDGNYLADVVSGKTKGKPASSRRASYSSPSTDYTTRPASYTKPSASTSDYTTRPASYTTPSSGYSASSPAGSAYQDTYEKPVITAVDTPSRKPNSIYERVPEPDATPDSSGGGSSRTGGASSSGSKPKSASSGSSSSSKSRIRPVPEPRSRPAAAVKPKPRPVTAKSLPKAKTKAPAAVSHKVRSGDTLYSLANRYGTSVAAIKQANGLSSTVLQNGRTIRIPRK